MDTHEFQRWGETDLQGGTILIVQENPFAGIDLYSLVETHNGRALGPLTRVADGLAMVKSVAIDAAVIDGQMAGWEALAHRLDFRQIPYIVQSGTAPDAEPGIISKQSTILDKASNVIDVLSALKSFSGGRKPTQSRKAS